MVENNSDYDPFEGLSEAEKKQLIQDLAKLELGEKELSGEYYTGMGGLIGFFRGLFWKNRKKAGENRRHLERLAAAKDDADDVRADATGSGKPAKRKTTGRRNP